MAKERILHARDSVNGILRSCVRSLPLHPRNHTTGLPACRRRHTKRVHPHGLRHTHAAELAMEGVPMPIIQMQLGHSNAATTSRYLQHIAPEQLISTIRQRTWQAS